MKFRHHRRKSELTHGLTTTSDSDGILGSLERLPYSWQPELPRRIIRRLSQSASSTCFVIDPFVGTGATLEAAKSLGLPAVGADADPRAAFLARVRVRDYSDNSLLLVASAVRGAPLQRIEPDSAEADLLAACGLRITVGGEEPYHIASHLESIVVKRRLQTSNTDVATIEVGMADTTRLGFWADLEVSTRYHPIVVTSPPFGGHAMRLRLGETHSWWSGKLRSPSVNRDPSSPQPVLLFEVLQNAASVFVSADVATEYLIAPGETPDWANIGYVAEGLGWTAMETEPLHLGDLGELHLVTFSR